MGKSGTEDVTRKKRVMTVAVVLVKVKGGRWCEVMLVRSDNESPSTS